MKKPILTFVISVLLPSIGVCDVKVFHFNNKTKHFDAININGLNIVQDFIVAGKYVWAVDYDHAMVAFYNGEKWNAGAKIPGLTKIFDFRPGYPESGEKPIAWVGGINHNANNEQTYELTYFDGNKWTKYEVASSNGDKFVESAAGGIGWLSLGNSIAFTSQDDPYNIIKMPYTRSSNTFYTNRSFVVADDINPTTYTIAEIKNSEGKLVSKLLNIDRFGNTKPLQPEFPLNQYGQNYYFDNNNHEILVGNLTTNTNFWYSADDGKSWVHHKIFIFPYSYGGMVNGMVCGAADNSEESDSKLTCINTTNPESKRLVFDIVNYPHQGGVRKIYSPVAGGIWNAIISTSYDWFPYLFFYDFSTGNKTNTEVSDYALHLTSVMALNKSEVLACGLDKDAKSIGLYYNGKEWKSSKFSDDTLLKCSSNTFYNTSPINTDNVWFFPYEKADDESVSKVMKGLNRILRK